MKKIINTIAIIALFAACFSFMSVNRTSARLNGNWSGLVATTNGGCQLDYKFSIVGDKVVGTAVSPQGEASIVDGTINGTDIEFTVAFQGTEVKHIGKYYSADDRIVMDLDLGGSQLHTILTKVANN
jgi:hypothetical protein